MSLLESVHNEIEDCINCPVCFELPLSIIEQCEKGHIICSACRQKCDACPLCRGAFFGTRNYALESLLERYKTAKINEKYSISDSGKHNVTKQNVVASALPVVPVRRYPPNASKGFFSCLFDSCKHCDKLPVSAMLNHVRYFHKDNLVESTTDGFKYNNTYKKQFIPSTKYVNAIQISDMGLFFLIIQITEEGVLYGYVRMVSHHEVAKKFYYQLTISSPNNVYKASFMNEIRSVREPYTRTLSTKLNECLALDEYIEKHLRTDKVFVCKLSIMFARPNVPDSDRHGLPTLLTINNRPHPASSFFHGPINE